LDVKEMKVVATDLLTAIANSTVPNPEHTSRIRFDCERYSLQV